MYRIIVSAIAGLLAGIATGFAGLSAAVFISPILVSFLDISSFSAIGIALASDVLASFLSAITYAKNKNTDLKKGKILFLSVAIFSIIGTLASFAFTANANNEEAMNLWLIISSMLLGLKLLIKPASERQEKRFKIPLNADVLSIVCGAYIGFVCGFQGTGGGLMMLLVLNYILGFQFKKAVGTSVTIMSVTALVGAVSHFVMAGGINDLKVFVICVLSTLAGAEIAALLANRMKPKTVKRITGFLMLLSGIITLIAKLT